MDLYAKMGNELRSLFKDLFDPSKQIEVSKKTAHLLRTAAQIGGSVYSEAEQLSKEIEAFLKNRKDGKLLALMKKHALHLEQETREI